MARRRKNKLKVRTDHQFAPQDYDTGTPELHKREPTDVYGLERKRRVRVISSPIDYYLAREFIDRDQHSAGTQFYRLWYHGGARPGIKTMDLLKVAGIHGDAEAGYDIRDRYTRAAECFRNAVAKRVVVDVVCVGEYADGSLRAAIREYVATAQSPRHGMRHLRDGLDDLIAHFSKRRNPNKRFDNAYNEN